MTHVEQKRRRFPLLLGFFLATGVVMLLQWFPVIGVFLMLLGAMFWSVALINLGMAGVALEALAGRVARGWLLLPVAFYVGYYGFAVADQFALRRLKAEIATANAAAHIPFDARQGVLVATPESREGARIDGTWLVQTFDLPVFYQRGHKKAQPPRATRVIDAATCTDLSANSALSAADINIFPSYVDGVPGGLRDRRFCTITQPEWPTFLEFTVARSVTEERVGSLPVRLTTTTVTSPDGRSFHLRGGFAKPLRWFPMPAMGCFPSWKCDAGFVRANLPLLPYTGSRSWEDDLVLAGALGLKRVPPEERRAADPGHVRTLAARAEADALAAELADFEKMIADPTAMIGDHAFRVLFNRPETLMARADVIMAGVERAAAAGSGAHNNGLALARLLSRLPRARFDGFGPRILALYAGTNGAYHWLWKADTLVNRLGDLGPDAVPLLIAPANAHRPAVLRSVEAACRLGTAGRSLGPLLQEQWKGPRNSDEREEIFVAMRRMGVEVPPLADDPRGEAAKIAAKWDDIGPESPARVCKVPAEREARRQERETGARRVNME